MDLASLLVVLTLIVLESLLSVDNAAVLAVMVNDLPEKQRPKALKYGLLGAFVFRGLCLLMASWLIKVMWLKILGGAYLLYLAIGHFTPKKDTIEEANQDTKKSNKWFLGLKARIGLFWSTVVLVEIMDLAFSIDNVFAAVAMTDNLYLIYFGVFVGIISMRFVAQWFNVLINRFPSLETSAFVVIFVLGIKLTLSGIIDTFHIFPSIGHVMETHLFDFIFSALTMLIFFIPIMLGRKNTIA
jgi:YkoY family integral membrane protein